MAKEYTREDMLKRVKKYFENQGYACEVYPAEHPVRIPLYGRKDDTKPTEEVVVDVFTSQTISKEDYFSELRVSTVRIHEASSLKFYQHYLPFAKVFLAYPKYSENSPGFDRLKEACMKSGIGLLRVSDRSVREDTVARPRILIEDFIEKVREAHKIGKLSEEVENLTQNYLHYLVYYPDPIFRRREIVDRPPSQMSFILIDELQKLKRIKQRDVLKAFAQDYRNDIREDYEIALGIIKKLWETHLRIDYPEFQKEFEPVLLLNPFYRDHFLHQFQVYLLGAIILDTLLDDVASGFKTSYGTDIEDVWLAAAPFHDFNYNIEEYEKWTRSFFEKSLNLRETNPAQLNLENSFVRENFLFETQKICNDISCPVDPISIRFFYERAVSQRNHAFLSSLSLLKLMQNGVSGLDKRAIDHAASTIVFHDEDNWSFFCGRYREGPCEPYEADFAHKKIIKKLQFTEFPLIFLLIFCDIIQEWGRVGRDYKEAEPELEKLEVTPREIIIRLSLKNDDHFERKRDEIKRVKKFLKDPRFGIKLICRQTQEEAMLRMTG